MEISPLDTTPYFAGQSITYSAQNLPSGLSLDTATGVISGTPTAIGVNSVTLTATNPAGSVDQVFDWTVEAAPATPGVEAGASGHWLLGSDNASYADLVSSQIATPGSASTPTLNPGFVTLPGIQDGGLDMGLPEGKPQTLCMVTRFTNQGAIAAGNLNNSGPGGVAIFFQSGTDFRVNNRGAFSQKVADVSPDTWYFVALAVGGPSNAALGFLGGASGSTSLALSSDITPNTDRSLFIGNGHYNAGGSFDDDLDVAEMIVLPSYLSVSDLEAVYARSVARVAARGVTVT